MIGICHGALRHQQAMAREFGRDLGAECLAPGLAGAAQRAHLVPNFLQMLLVSHGTIRGFQFQSAAQGSDQLLQARQGAGGCFRQTGGIHHRHRVRTGFKERRARIPDRVERCDRTVGRNHRYRWHKIREPGDGGLQKILQPVAGIRLGSGKIGLGGSEETAEGKAGKHTYGGSGRSQRLGSCSFVASLIWTYGSFDWLTL